MFVRIVEGHLVVVIGCPHCRRRSVQIRASVKHAACASCGNRCDLPYNASDTIPSPTPVW